MVKKWLGKILKILLSGLLICAYLLIVFYIPHGLVPIGLIYLMSLTGYSDQWLPVVIPGSIGMGLIVISHFLEAKIQDGFHLVGTIGLYLSWIGLLWLDVGSEGFDILWLVIFSLPFQIIFLVCLVAHLRWWSRAASIA